MQVKITPNEEQSETTLEVSVEAAELDSYVKKAAAYLTKDKALPGFRPGKAPADVVAEAFGEERLMHVVSDRAVPQFFVKAVMDNDVQAIAQPKVSVESLDRKTGMKFKAIVAVLPEVTLGDFKDIKIEKRPVKVSDEDIDKELKVLAKMRASYLDVARPAQPGDTVRVDFEISINGTPLEGGDGKDHPVHLGEGHFVEDFEKKLEGISAGDAREFDITFPDDYGKKDYAGKTAQAKVKAQAVQKQVIPEMNDDFAKQAGKFANLAELKKVLKENMVNEKEQKEKERWQGELSEKLAANATFGHIPDILIEKEIDRNIGELNEMLAMQKKTFEDYVREQGKEAKDVRADMRPNAVQRVKVGLALRAFSDKEDIAVDEKEVDERVQEYLKRFSSAEEAEKSIDPDELKEQLTYMLRNQKTLGALEKLVTIKEAKQASESVEEKTEESVR